RRVAALARPPEAAGRSLAQPLSSLSRTDLALLRRAHIGIVGQEPGLVPFLSALDTVGFSLQLPGRRGATEAKALAALAEMGLGHRAVQRVDRLSAGERQRVAV